MENLDKLIGMLMNWQHWDVLINIGAAALTLYMIFFFGLLAFVLTFIFRTWQAIGRKK